MYDNKALCEKIRQIFPDIGECGIALSVSFDKNKDAYIVDLKKGAHELITHLEPEDADICMAGKQCVGLGIQIAQLRANVKTA